MSFDRLLQKLRDARNERLLEEARLFASAMNYAYTGEEKVMKSIEDAYTPQALKDAVHQGTIERDMRRLETLFGG